MKKNKILFLLPSFKSGGAEMVTLHILNQLDTNVFDIILCVVNPVGPLQRLVPSGVKLAILNVSRCYKSFYKLYFTIYRLRPNVIFCSVHRFSFILSCLNSFFSDKAQLVFRVPNNPYSEFNRSFKNIIFKYVYSFAYNQARYCIVQSNLMKKQAHKYFSLDSNNIIKINNPINEQYIRNNIKDRKSPFDDLSVNIVSCGRLCDQKRFDRLINAFREVVKNDNSYQLHILGPDHGKKKELINLVTSLNLSDHVTFHGEIENPFPFFFYADGFVLTSDFEGFPNVVLENVFLGTPVITTNTVSELSQYIKDGYNGYVIDFNDLNKLPSLILSLSEMKGNTLKFNNSNFNYFFKNISTLY